MLGSAPLGGAQSAAYNGLFRPRRALWRLVWAGCVNFDHPLAIEMGADAVDIGKTIHPHPTLGESIGMAAEVAHGSCTDVPPARK